ncbi:uncharacterized protein LOC123895101 isoform X1 [Trifolium pratense]|uniref:uncharacterized protein LOC123895101 isoform X1 n=1 Tax=Trifolium pratense TaxID=57577 RepID=UPI001E6949FE|nr:uncharacterized protein LOC123895101 isoform X1 [Trifolium pratense]
MCWIIRLLFCTLYVRRLLSPSFAKKRLARKARQKAEEEARQKAEKEACQKKHVIEYLKWLIPFAAHSHWLSLEVIANSVNTDGNEQLQNLVQRFLNKDITEKSIILDFAPQFCKEYGVDTLDFEHYDPNSPYPPPTNNPYMHIERE